MTEKVYNALKDIVSHTHAIGVTEPVKIVGTPDSTKLETSIRKAVLIQAEFIDVVSEFDGTFGLPNLAKLHTILNIPEYAKNSKVTVSSTGEGIDKQSDGIHFSNENGDFTNDYRLMGSKLINVKVPPFTYMGNAFPISFEPSKEAIQRLKYQTAANGEVENLIVSTTGNNLEFSFGDRATFAGKFVFANDVGSLHNRWGFPVSHMNAILNLPGEKAMFITDDGVAKIVVSSEYATYTYYLPAIAV